MGKKKVDNEPVDVAPIKQRASLLPAILFGVLALLLSAGTSYVVAAQPKPLGVPIPRPPQPMFKLTEKAGPDSSLIKRQLPKGWIGRLALQADGLPYLFQVYHSDKLGFTMRYPYGTENVQYGSASFAGDAVESQANVRIDQPLAAIKVSLPNNEGLAQLEFAKHIFEGALKSGAKPVDQPKAVELPGGGFATFAYRRSDPDSNYVHRMYCAVAKKRVLIFDFFIRPDFADAGERYAEKIMRSFEPGSLLGPALEVPSAKTEQKPEPAEPSAPVQVN